MKIDVIIPYHNKDRKVINHCIASCFENIRHLGKIYLITNKEIGFLKKDVKIIHEDKFFKPPLSKAYIKDRWKKEYPEISNRAGWLYQQFIKMGCTRVIRDLTDYFLVLDSDVVFMKEVDLLSNNKMLMTKTETYHESYFECYQKLIGETANREFSFVAHFMIIKKSIMLELLDTIEERFNKSWYDAILDCIDYRDASPFSEYETYGHYLKKHYPDEFELRELRCLQDFTKIPKIDQLKEKTDYLALHSHLRERRKRKYWWYKLYLFLIKIVMIAIQSSIKFINWLAKSGK